MPRFKLSIKAEEKKAGFGRFVIEPLERGFGHTLGNSLRRVLLSSLPGAAATRVKIAGVQHEFSTLPGVTEDVVELILNLKKIYFGVENKKTNIVTLEVAGPAEVKAADIVCPTGIKVINPEQHLATLADKKSLLEMEVTVEYGKGYRLPEKEVPLGVIALDADFSPVKLVSYKVESTRVGRETDLDKLIIEITSNDTIDPKKTLQQAAAILVDHFSIIQEGEELEVVESERKPSEERKAAPPPEAKVYLEEFNLPTRVLNTLKKADLETVKDLQQLGKDGLSNIKNVGPKTVQQIWSRVEKYEKES